MEESLITKRYTKTIKLIEILFLKLESGWYIILFLLPFTAIKGDYFEQIRDFKYIFIAFLISITLFVFIASTRYTVPKSPVLLPFIAMVAVFLISSLNSVDYILAWKGIFFTLPLYFVGFVILVPAVFNRTGQLSTGIKIVLISGLLSSLFAVAQSVGNFLGFSMLIRPIYQRNTGIFGSYPFPRAHALSMEPLNLSSFLLFILAISFSLWIAPEIPLKCSRRFVGLTALFSFLGIIAAASRAGWLSLSLMGVSFALIFRRRLWLYKNRIALLFLIVLLMVIFLIGTNVAGVWAFAKIEVGRFVSGANVASSIDYEHRLKRLYNFLEVVFEYPFFGQGGLRNLGLIHYELIPGVNNAPRVTTSLNSYIDIAVEEGLLGLFAFAWLLGAYFVQVIKASRRADYHWRFLLIGFIVGMLAYAFQLNFFNGFEEQHFWAFLGLGLATSRVGLIEFRRSITNPP